MNYKMIGTFLGRILLVEAIFLIPALFISVYHSEGSGIAGIGISIAIIVLLAVLLLLIGKNATRGFFAKEGFVCVGISWIVMSIMGALPFYISGEIPKYIDALFETVSGFTTTGASILPEVESMSKGLLYWRSFTHWLGGMGVLVFVLALGSTKDNKQGFTMHLLRAESPGPSVGKLVPKMRTTATILYALYFGLTVIDFIFLMIGGMPVFDSICTAFGTAGTGGFGIKNDSIAGYSPYIQNVCTVFMALFGVNFTVYYMLMLKQVKSIFKDEELRLYLGMMLGSIALISYNIRGVYPTLEETIRHAAFQVSSIMTTTGFATTDFDLWPSFSKGILLTLMLVGASAGSTGGGMKVARLLLIVKTLRRNVLKVIHPNKVQVVRVNKESVNERVLENTNSYLAAYVLIIVASFLIVSIEGQSMITNLSSVIACFNNIGPGFDAVGATCNYGGLSVLSKSVLILDMLAGRLEIFPILILFVKSTWSK